MKLKPELNLSSEPTAEDLTSSQTIAKPLVKCWCFLCHIELVEEKEKFGMHGEIVCPECYNDNMYMALQNSGGL